METSGAVPPDAMRKGVHADGRPPTVAVPQRPIHGCSPSVAYGHLQLMLGFGDRMLRTARRVSENKTNRPV